MNRERLKGVIIGVMMTLILTVAVPVFAQSISKSIRVTYRDIGIKVDGQTVVAEQEPFIFEGRTYLAARDIAVAFGSEIKMNEATNTVEITSRKTANESEKTPAPSSVSATDRNNRPSNPGITKERAEQIAEAWLKDNKITNAKRHDGISMDFEKGCWVWELEYENNAREWDFRIDVNTGEIVEVDSDKN